MCINDCDLSDNMRAVALGATEGLALKQIADAEYSLLLHFACLHGEEKGRLTQEVARLEGALEDTRKQLEISDMGMRFFARLADAAETRRNQLAKPPSVPSQSETTHDEPPAPVTA